MDTYFCEFVAFKSHLGPITTYCLLPCIESANTRQNYAIFEETRGSPVGLSPNSTHNCSWGRASIDYLHWQKGSCGSWWTLKPASQSYASPGLKHLVLRNAQKIFILPSFNSSKELAELKGQSVLFQRKNNNTNKRDGYHKKTQCCALQTEWKGSQCSILVAAGKIGHNKGKPERKQEGAERACMCHLQPARRHSAHVQCTFPQHPLLLFGFKRLILGGGETQP